MQENINVSILPGSSGSYISPIEDYSQILKCYNIDYISADYYLQVGEIKLVQGWILHISVVIHQFLALLNKILPFLIDENITFKVAMNKQVCNHLLNGDLGIAQIGKLISIYPQSQTHAVYIAKKMIELTPEFKGPYIPTDYLLGSVIYTRYGSFNPILITNSNGTEEKFIYDPSGQLIIDPYSIPFMSPVGVKWPFEEITPLIFPKPRQVLKNTYRIISILKEDVKGNVYKGIYLKSLFNVKNCVIKQGFKHMSSEDTGRDIYDRLAWQHELYHDLVNIVPMPEIYDFIQDKEGSSYLIMQYIDGISLYEKIKEINPSSKSWLTLGRKEVLVLLRLILKLIDIIEALHLNGYVHRDIAPPNFLVDKRGNLFLIDLELSYSLRKHKPTPPFEYGTAGFMSPEQQKVLRPTVKEDIYGLGALMLEIFTGVTPIKIDTSNSGTLLENISFFTGAKEVSLMIKSCLHHDPQKRPNITEIKNVINNYRQNFISTVQPTVHLPIHSKPNKSSLKDHISSALAGLNKAPTIALNDFWYSKMATISNLSISQHKEYKRYPGLVQGMGGVLYLLARAKKSEFTIEGCETRYEKGWAFIHEQYAESLSNAHPGLYTGSSGIAVALKEGMDSGLLSYSPGNRNLLQEWLGPSNLSIDIANGVSGQGLALLQCKDYLESDFVKTLLRQYISLLLNSQQNDGSWEIPNLASEEGKKEILSFAYGTPGIVWFLMECYSLYPMLPLLSGVEKALTWLSINQYHSRHSVRGPFLKKNSPIRFHETTKQNSTLLVFIKAYEVFKDDIYKHAAEKILLQYPSNIVSTNFCQMDGLAGIGEIYIEAARVFKDETWMDRAGWIANVFSHTLKKNRDGSGYWQIEERNDPTADFMTGTAGIIHFLIRFLSPDNLGYRILK